ncbi:imidazole glycerol phosphate synthase subunit HisH [Polynucleobacter difficilis]|uniref:imidazole glycerol phosphate synthase subunit HisH n=1 Tax=Polynucleobacter difficilis TaxID=556054 RepID=UPI001F415871|nr:imidazole glycerol phosphate synthase subunit HisH [Polynucleobacter difficilis]
MEKNTITIIGFPYGNIGSLVNMFKHLKVNCVVESDPKSIAKATRIVLPGVGAFDQGMQCLNSVSGLIDVLNKKALVEKIPILGVCLGMQMLTDGSDEGSIPGLGWIKGKASRFPEMRDLKIPHMGWNISTPTQNHSLFKDISIDPKYYFVHSYMVQATNPVNVLMKANYGVEFDSAIGSENICGVQFHPEKSHKYGKQILKNFSEM